MSSSGVSIGRGRFGAVMRYGNHAPYVAVKRIYIYSDRIKKYTERELKAFEKLSHSNIVKFYGHKQITHDGFAFLMTYMEFCERLSLRHVLADSTVVYNLKTVFVWAEHLASSLLCLKDNQILHRDIKPANVFVTNRFILKLGDFGLGKEMDTGSSMSLVGTDRYMSPEASGHFGKAETNYKSDLYAMGLVLWEMVERREVFSPEYEIQGIHAIFNGLKNGRYTSRFTDLDAELAKLILECIRFDHSSRPDIVDFFEKIAHLNSNYDEETFQPLTQISQEEIQKPNWIRRMKTNNRDLLQKELIDQLIKRIPVWVYRGYISDEVKANLDNDKQEQSTSFMNKSLKDAISMLKTLAIQQSDFQLMEMFETRIQNFSTFPDDYIFCNYKYPNFPPMIDQELLDFFPQKYGRDFVENIKSALKVCEHCFRYEFRVWFIETLAAIDWHRKAMEEPHYLLEAIEQIHSIISKLLDNPFYNQWLVVGSYETGISTLGIKLLSKEGNAFQSNPFCFVLKGFHIESCLKDLQEILENLFKDTKADQEILKNYLKRYQPRECVFPYRAYRFEWGKRVDECEEIKMSALDPESLADYESLRLAYEWGLKIMMTYSKRKEKSLNKNEQISQINTCLFELKKPRKCPNYFYFNARELRDDESQNVNILSIKEPMSFTYFLGDDLIWRWKKTEYWFCPPYTIIRVHLVITLLSHILHQYESLKPGPSLSRVRALAQSSCSLM